MADADGQLDHMLASAARDPSTAQGLLQLLYTELHAAAQRHMAAERAGHTLSATALVHEAYLRLIGSRDIPWENRAHFFSAAIEAMQRILVDHARSRNRQKRGGQHHRIDLEAAAQLCVTEEDSADFLALAEAIARLQEVDERSAELVRLRYYAGLSVEEAAGVLGVSKRTASNDWAFAKAWLHRALAQDA